MKNASKYIKIVLLLICMAGATVVGAIGGSVVEVIKTSPEIDLSKIGDTLSENSVIVDQDGNLLEQIETAEYRELVSIDEIPSHVKNAFISVEDERFYGHLGVDIIGIVKSAIDNITAGGIVRGGSTITQQLARDLYLNDEKTLDRKIKEAYIALKMTEQLDKDEILEIYLNRVFLGQNAYGIQAAAKTYFSKDVKDLTISEAASLAAIPKAPTEFSLYFTVKPESIKDQNVLGEVYLSGEKYLAIYNPNFEERKDFVISKMKELGYIDEDQYNIAKSQDIAKSIKTPEKKKDELSTYFNSVVKAQVIDKLMEKFNLSEEEAMDKLYNGGLTIKATIDLDMQKKLEGVYDDFQNNIVGGTDEESAAIKLLNIHLSEEGNITDKDDNILYYKKSNLYNVENELIIPKDDYELNDDGLFIKQKRLAFADGAIIIKPFYTLTDYGSLKTHDHSTIQIPDNNLTLEHDSRLKISKGFLNSNPNFIKETEDGLVISKTNYTIDEVGVLQPQSSTVIMDQTTGQIRALIGGRDEASTKNKHNRAYSNIRQPGSTMKPIGVYAPALDTGSTLATVIDDLPHYNEKKELWPINWYNEYRGMMTIRESIEVSANVNAVKMLEKIGLKTSKEYLEKFGLINPDNPELDSFVTTAENQYINDENTSAMALGGMARGVSNIRMTAAYAALANKGEYIEPLSFSEVTDSKGNIILGDEPKRNQAVSEEVAFLITDALRGTTEQGVARNAQIDGTEIAGKTGTSGTTEDNQDSWFIGYTPEYTIGVWLGADDQRLKLKEVSQYTTRFWSSVGTKVLPEPELTKFKKPRDIVELEVCTKSGMLPSDACYADHRGVVKKEFFAKDNVPKKECNVHVWRTVDANDGLLITSKTPEHYMATRSFITRATEYKPEDNQGIKPTDWYMMAPTAYSPNDYYVPPVEETENTEHPDGETTEHPDGETSEPPNEEATLDIQ